MLQFAEILQNKEDAGMSLTAYCSLIMGGTVLGGLVLLVLYSLLTMAKMGEDKLDWLEYQILLQKPEGVLQSKH